MRPLEHLLVDLAAAVSPHISDQRGSVQVTDAEVALPVEFGSGGGAVLASLPRGRLATGFVTTTSQMRVVFGTIDHPVEAPWR